MKIAFCGFRHGHINGLYKMASESKDWTVTGVWEENAEAKAAAQAFVTDRFYDSYEALLADDAEIIAVGDYYGIRGQRIIQALKAGKHVITDKPVCTSLSELDEIERLSKEKKLCVSCMLDLRYDPAVRLARDLVRNDEIGQIHAVNFTGQHPLNYGTRPMWYFEEGKHGGTFNDILIHGIDAVKMITGLGKITTIAARQWNAFAKERKQFLDSAQLIAAYENGAGLLADVSYSAPSGVGFRLPNYWRFSLFGERGMIEFKVGSGKLLLAKAGDEEPSERTAEPYSGNFLTDLQSEIKTGCAEFVTADTLHSSRMALEIQKCADERN